MILAMIALVLLTVVVLSLIVLVIGAFFDNYELMVGATWTGGVSLALLVLGGLAFLMLALCVEMGWAQIGPNWLGSTP